MYFLHICIYIRTFSGNYCRDILLESVHKKAHAKEHP